MKRLYAFLLCGIFLISLTACKTNESQEAQDPAEAFTHLEFQSIEELISYETEKQINEASLFSVESDAIFVPYEALVAEEFNANLQSIEISGNNYYYCFELTGPTNNSGNTAYSLQEADETDKGEITEDMIQTCSENLVIGWFRGSDGEEVLNSFAELNPVEYWEEHPGYYYTTTPYSDMDNPLGYMVYWVQGGEFFQASVPSDKLNVFWDNIDTMIEKIRI